MVKIRVFLITAFICAQYLSNAQKACVKDKTTYYLSSIFIGKQKNTLAKDKGHIVFNTTQKSATCFTSCNFIQLKYTMNDKVLKFTEITPDKEPCSDRLIGLESDFKENLPKVTNYALKGKNLIFLNNKDTLMIFHEPEKDQK